MYIVRGVGFDVFMFGFEWVIQDVKQKWGILVYLIMLFLCYFFEKDVIDILNQVRVYYFMIKVVGLDSLELGNLLEKFVKVFVVVCVLGFKCVVYVGEEGFLEYIWQVLDLLYVDCIDYGVWCVEDVLLIQCLKDEGMFLMVCL